MIFKPRSDVFGPGVIPTSTSGGPRPLMELNRPYFTIHYTGGGVWLDPNDTIDEIKQIQAYAQGAKKPWEYNYIVDGQGVVWEYAGLYRSAAYSNPNTPDEDNHLAFSCLLLIGFKGTYPNNVEYWEKPTEEMILAVRELRQDLLDGNWLAKDHKMLQHNQMPGAQTICPGPAAIARWADFTKPLLIPPPVGPKGAKMKPRFIRFDGFANVWYFDSGNVCAMNENVMNSLLAEDPTIEKIFVKPDHRQSRNAYINASGMTLNDLVEMPSTDHF